MCGATQAMMFLSASVSPKETPTSSYFEKRFPKGDFMQRPHITVADMDNDGQKDIVITSWEGVCYVINDKGES